MDWQTMLITLFVLISNQFDASLWPYCQRFSNNSNPKFTDEEIITIYLFGIVQKRFTLKEIYQYTQNHLFEWFPQLPSYGAFVQRLNRFESVFPALVKIILDNYSENNLNQMVRLIDSMPIILAHAKRSSNAKVASQLANKGYCASKSIYYYGVKLHVLGIKREGALPIPNFISVTPAGDHDLNAFRQIAPELKGFQLYADKAYINELEQQQLKQQNQLEIITPVKKKKGQKHLDFFEKLLSTSVSSIRQPIESLFNWIEEKTRIQIASKVRSYQGLCVHVFGKLAAAMFLLVFNP